MKAPASVWAALIAAGLGLGVGSETWGGEDLDRAGRMLETMNRALRSLDYEGTLVHLQDNRLETLHLVHRIDGGRVQERLVSLSGPIMAVTRESDRVTCVMPDGHPISVKSQAGRNLLRTDWIDPAQLADWYEFRIEGAARIAGRDTDVLVIKPRDDLRYGYRLHLDRVSGLPLKSDLLDHAGEPIEQLMFTALVLDEAGGAAGERDPAREGAGGQQGPPALAGDSASSRWRFEPRPAGFEPILHDVMRAPSGAEVEHFVFSDRLSAYSIYIEPDAAEGLDGVTRIGAVHAVGRKIAGHQVTVVGEVPSATVQAAVAGVRPSGEAGR
jgi:sigma-E factor negative regulatory protein RseB